MAEMKEILVANLTLDTTRRNNIPPLIVPQGDYGARVIKAKITVLGNPVTVPNTASVSIVADRNGDSEALAFSGKVNADGSVTVPVTQWMLDVPENYVTCHIEATGIDYKYSTTHFLIEPEKKANPTEITPDDPRKDVVTEVLAGEKDRVIEEAKRRANENTRKSAEEARQRAEEQRLTDEATRVANEAERVSSELSRDATFKGWANDIASLPSFDSRISANSDRLTNIEAGLPSSVWHVDDTVARVKDVPENARPKAIVNKIGGMSYKTENLIPFPYIDTTKTAGGVTFTLNADRSITFSGDATEGYEFALGVVPIKQGESYALSIAGSASNIHYQIRFIDTSGIFISTATIESGKLNLVVTPNQIPTEAVAMIIYLKRLANDVVSGTIYPMCNPGSTAKPYSPYFEGLRSAKVTEVKSVGVNLVSVNRASLQSGGYIFNVALSTPLEAGKYTVSFKASNYESSSAVSLAFLDANGQIFADVANGLEETSSLTLNANKRVYHVYLYTNSSIGIEAKDIMLNKGSTAKPYSPYVEHILPIPEELRPANGINAEVYDSIELNENGSVTKRVKCGVVDLGTLDWVYSKVYMQFSCELPSKAFGRKNMKCAPYNIIDRDGYASGLPDMSMHGHISISKVYVTNLSYSDAATFKAAMSGVMLVYELAEPEVTDTYADLIIDVEGGGTLTFEDEYGYDMPNTVTYMLKEVTS